MLRSDCPDNFRKKVENINHLNCQRIFSCSNIWRAVPGNWFWDTHSASPCNPWCEFHSIASDQPLTYFPEKYQLIFFPPTLLWKEMKLLKLFPVVQPSQLDISDSVHIVVLCRLNLVNWPLVRWRPKLWTIVQPGLYQALQDSQYYLSTQSWKKCWGVPGAKVGDLPIPEFFLCKRYIFHQF